MATKDNFKNLEISELAKLISPSSEAFLELKNRGILRTKNIVGELGEYYAVDFYTKNPKLPGLSMAPPTVKNIDALSRNGEIYSIKTITSRKGTTGSFWDPESIKNNEKKFDYLLNLYPSTCLPLLGISALSEAKFRVGPHWEEYDFCFDLMLKAANNDLMQFTDEVLIYLKNFGNGQV